MFDKILSSPLKAVTTLPKKAPPQMFDRVLNFPLITSKSFQPLVILAKLLTVCLLNLINIKYCARSLPRDLIFNIFAK